MKLTIFLQKEVETVEQAQGLLDTVQTQLSDYPDVKISGSVNTELTLAEIPS